MFQFLKRLVSPVPEAPAPRRRKPAHRTRTANEFDDTAPLPEVTEGNQHSDWELWEDSVVTLDSRMQGLMPSARIYEEPERLSEYQELDPYSAVRRKDP